MLTTVLGWLTGNVLDSLLGPIKDIFLKFQDRKISEAELDAEIRKALLATFADVAKTQSNVIIAEAQGEDWLQRNWRPIVALSCSFILVFYGLITPIMVGWLGWPPVRIGDQLLEWIFTLVTICLGGYIAGRSIEKTVGTILTRK